MAKRDGWIEKRRVVIARVKAVWLSRGGKGS